MTSRFDINPATLKPYKKASDTRYPKVEAGQVAKIQALMPARLNVLQSTDLQRIVYHAQVDILHKVIQVLEDEV